MNPESFDNCLEGGDVEKGKQIFFTHLAGQCVRCHKYERKGPGSVIGPNLWKIGENGPEYLLEALVAPQKTIAKGYGTLTITRKDGTTVSGVLVSENKKGVTVNDSTTGKDVSIPAKDIKNKGDAISVMPPMGAILKRGELRDLVAYLETLRER